MTKKHKTKISFKRLYLIYTGIILTSICIFLFFLWNYLKDYQLQLPSSLGDEILTAYQTDDVITLRKYLTNLPDELQDNGKLSKYIEQSDLQNDLYYYENNTTSDSITYTFRLRGQDFATLIVSAADKKSAYGFPIYTISSLEQNVMHTYTIVEAPGTTVFLGKNQISADNITSQTSLDAPFDGINENSFLTTTYTIPDYLLSDGVTAVLANGEACNVSWNEDHSICTTSIQISDQDINALTKFVTQAAKEYAIFATIKNAPRQNLMQYLYPGTNFYQAITSYSNSWGIAKTADSFDNIIVSDFMQCSETEYICTISFDYIVTQNQLNQTYPLSLRCYISSQNGSYKIVNMESVS